MTSCALATRQTQNTNAHSHTHTNTHTHTHTHTHAHEGSYTQLLNSVYRALNAMFPTKHEQDLVQHCKNGGVHAPPSAIPMAQRPPLPPPAATVNVQQAGADLRYASISRSLLPYNRSLLTLTHTSGMRKCQERPNWQKRPIPVSKETYLYGKRGLKISIPQVCASVKRDLFTWQKRPVYMAKEAYLYGKRGAFVWQKRPICTAKVAY